MAELFDQHFCLPSRGDSGEVFAALYMLLCGDALRYKKDRYMRLFDVELGAWLVELKGTSENREGPMGPETSMEQEKAEVRRSPRLKAADDMTQETMDTDMEKGKKSMTSLLSTDSKRYLNFIQTFGRMPLVYPINAGIHVRYCHWMLCLPALSRYRHCVSNQKSGPTNVGTPLDLQVSKMRVPA